MENSDSSDHFNEEIPADNYEPDDDINEGGKRKRSSKERLIQIAVILFFVLIFIVLWRLK